MPPDAPHPGMRIIPKTSIWAMAGLLCLYLGVTIFVTDENSRLVITDLLTPLIGLLATVVLFYTAWMLSRKSYELATAWTVLAVGCLAWALGDVLWAVLEVFLQEPPFPSIADFFYLAYYPLIIVGFLLIPYERASRQEIIKTWLDMGIVFIAAGLIYWNFLIGPAAAVDDAGSSSFIISMAYPVFDLVLFAGVMYQLYRKQKAVSLAVQLSLTASIILQIIADTLYGLQSNAGTYNSGTLLDLLWPAGFVAFGLSGIFQLRAASPTTHADPSDNERVVRNRVNFWLSFTPYLWMAAAYALLIYANSAVLPMSYQSIAVGTGVMIIIILIRQILSIFEITRLSGQLRQDLIEREITQDFLQQSYAELEDRIKQRTLDLTRANEALKNEIAERRLVEDSLHEKDVLLKEIHHRVKNNLQIISSLLKLQTNQIKDPALVVTMMDSQTRIQSMALIHEKLYKSTDLENIDFAEYLDSLAINLYQSYNTGHKEIAMRVDAVPVKLEIDKAVPCGLVITELVSNAIKHAFPNQDSGEIIIQMTTAPDNQVQIIVSDNGVGIPANMDIDNSPTLGLQLVNALVGQLDGNLEITRDHGTRVKVSFAA
jgi:two-component sensor histidine kinase